MTNHCPKCGAETKHDSTQKIYYKCVSAFEKARNTFVQSVFCRGRAEAIAELDAWHTGEPPEGEAYYLIKTDPKARPSVGNRVPATFNSRIMVWRVDSQRSAWRPQWQWREVRP